MDDPRIAAELRTGAYDGLSNAAAAAVLDAKTVSVAPPGRTEAEPDEVIDAFSPKEWRAAKRLTDAEIEHWFDRLMARRRPVDLAGATFAAGLAFLVARSVLTQARADAIRAALAAAPAATTARWEPDTIDEAAVASIRLRMQRGEL